jgi:Na+/H+-translocating membrane pyrophosphatase
VTVVATMVLASIFFGGMSAAERCSIRWRSAALRHHLDHRHVLRQARPNNSIMGALYKGLIVNRRSVDHRLGGATSSDHRLGAKFTTSTASRSPARTCSSAVLSA